MTTTAGKARAQARRTRTSGSVRIWYAVAVAAFTSSLTPAFGSRVAEGATSTGGSPATVLILIGLVVFGLFAGVVGPLILDVLLLLSARIAGANVRFREVSLLVDKALPALVCGVLASTLAVLVLGADQAFTSSWPVLVMGVAVVTHLVLLFRALRTSALRGVRSRAVAVGLYVAMPAAFMLLGQMSK